MKAFPLLSRAMQNAVAGHDTDQSETPGSMEVAVHVEPLKTTASPATPPVVTPMQKVDDTHEMDDMS